ncbi:MULTISPECIES: SsrA-binding protein SmpB [unclassified Dehalobacter]|uniref:SsrA-binding protein SmpB n=1 Tax=unclassified Dehalobacter TaxID=2635733 RepID=UPI00028AF84B|nr:MULTISPECIES: SsrA-binding protein SmpB [unclassified Dehalobacter]AFV03843.1 tmRNA-binding protein SmpB [Dehalobacter sp. DCA]AFV06825.1 tmRNA-binding protein SmpB [Dehalobacter sp. CF]EQB21411.1 tmRNA-binding protein SmpB [Dehalobacter sp. UNSWDHB]MCG1024711.1 SsrA-binding protein SmpB [Dehalobacter sp.]MCM1567274.1 SsrA-binding protein SmpB [Dehalobacter sp.]
MAEGIKVIAENRKARHDFFVEDSYEAGIILTGTEIKSIRAGRVNLKDSYAEIIKGEVWLNQMHISPYEQGNRFNHDPLRKRKLLLNRTEIIKMGDKVKLQGMTLVPLKIYLKHGMAKIELGLCKGKKTYDKRDDLAERDAKRQMERDLRDRNKG